MYEKIVQLKLESTAGKKYATDCANHEVFEDKNVDDENSFLFDRKHEVVGLENLMGESDISKNYNKDYVKLYLNKRGNGPIRFINLGFNSLQSLSSLQNEILML